LNFFPPVEKQRIWLPTHQFLATFYFLISLLFPNNPLITGCYELPAAGWPLGMYLAVLVSRTVAAAVFTNKQQAGGI